MTPKNGLVASELPDVAEAQIAEFQPSNRKLHPPRKTSQMLHLQVGLPTFLGKFAELRKETTHFC